MTGPSERPPSGDRRDGGRRSVLIVGAGLIALLAIAVLVAVLASRPTEPYPVDSPEGTFQRYLAAFDAGDLETAHGYFSTTVQRRVSLERYQRAVDDYRYWGEFGERLTLDRVNAGGDRATLEMTVHQRSGGPFGDEWSYPIQIRLVREDGIWRIDQALLRYRPMDEYILE